jgi:restriction system protein
MALTSILKGWAGELMGAAAHRLLLEREVYRALNNVTLQSGHGTVQIDHVIVSRYGIFVIEAKHYQGWIFGNEYQAQWTQCLPGGRKFRFQNPLRQNYRHIRTMMEFLGLPEDKFHSVVMFWGDSEFKTPMPANVLCRNYSSYIRGKTEVLFIDAEVEQLVEALETGRLPTGLLAGLETRRVHIESLRERHASTSRCPTCGAALIERVARRGARAGERFLACSAFPKCRFTKAAEG